MPQALVFIDHDRARALGYDHPPNDLWPTPEAEGGTANDGQDAATIDALLAEPLSAPLEAHPGYQSLRRRLSGLLHRRHRRRIAR